jgi:hypothetical protein
MRPERVPSPTHKLRTQFLLGRQRLPRLQATHLRYFLGKAVT